MGELCQDRLLSLLDELALVPRIVRIVDFIDGFRVSVVCAKGSPDFIVFKELQHGDFLHFRRPVQIMQGLICEETTFFMVLHCHFNFVNVVISKQKLGDFPQGDVLKILREFES